MGTTCDTATLPLDVERARSVLKETVHYDIVVPDYEDMLATLRSLDTLLGEGVPQETKQRVRGDTEDHLASLKRPYDFAKEAMREFDALLTEASLPACYRENRAQLQRQGKLARLRAFDSLFQFLVEQRPVASAAVGEQALQATKVIDLRDADLMQEIGTNTDIGGLRNVLGYRIQLKLEKPVGLNGGDVYFHDGATVPKDEFPSKNAFACRLRITQDPDCSGLGESKFPFLAPGTYSFGQSIYESFGSGHVDSGSLFKVDGKQRCLRLKCGPVFYDYEKSREGLKGLLKRPAAAEPRLEGWHIASYGSEIPLLPSDLRKIIPAEIGVFLVKGE